MVFTDFREFFTSRARSRIYCYADQEKLKFKNKLAAKGNEQTKLLQSNSHRSLHALEAITRNYAIFQCATWLRHKRDFRHRDVLNSVTCLKGTRKKAKEGRKKLKNSKAIALNCHPKQHNIKLQFRVFVLSASSTPFELIANYRNRSFEAFAKRLKIYFSFCHFNCKHRFLSKSICYFAPRMM